MIFKKNNKNLFIHGRGFTLIELLVVISIISVLSTVVLASLNSARDKARLSATTSTLLQIQKAVQLYAVDHNGNFPLSEMAGNDGIGNAYVEYNMNNTTPGVPDLSVFLDKIIPAYMPSAPKFNRMSFLESNQANSYVNLTYVTFPNSQIGARNIFYDVNYHSDPSDAIFCGGIKKEKYIIYIDSDLPLKLNLPELSYIYGNGLLHTNPIDGNSYLYCIGE